MINIFFCTNLYTQKTASAKLLDLFKNNGCEIKNNLTVYIDPSRNHPSYYDIIKTIYLCQQLNALHLGQFAYQLSHELVHAYMDTIPAYPSQSEILERISSQSPKPFTWLEELFASNISYYALDFLENEKIQPLNHFKSYKTIVLESVQHNEIETNKKWLSENSQNLLTQPTLVYNNDCSLSRYLYDHRENFNIWVVLYMFKKFVTEKYNKTNYTYFKQVFDIMKADNPDSTDLDYFGSLLFED